MFGQLSYLAYNGFRLQIRISDYNNASDPHSPTYRVSRHIRILECGVHDA